MTILSVDNIFKSYGERILFDNMSFTLEDQDKVGLIGINGMGKSTLLNIISGLDGADAGTITTSRGLTIEYLAQNPVFNQQATVIEQVLKGDSLAMKAIREYQLTLEDIINKPDNIDLQILLAELTSQITSLDAWHLESQVKTILSKLGIRHYEQRMVNLSGGQRKRVALAASLITPCDLLLMDEPTNHLDNDTIEWLEKYLANRKGALLMITHDRYFLDRVVNKIFELDCGNLYIYDGSYSSFVEKKIERRSLESAMQAKRFSLYRKELEWIRTGPRARRTKQKARIQRFEELKESVGVSDDSTLDMSVGHSRLGKKTLEIANVSKSYDGIPVIKDFDYILLRNDRIGIIGDNATGKSTLLNILAGKIEADNGSIDIGPTVKIAYLSQESEDMDQSLRAIEYIKSTAEYVTTAEGNKISAGKMMERFLFPPDLQWTPIARLSGGEKRRLYLLKVLMDAPNLLLLDEPTNDLDINTLQVLENYIDEFNGAVISASHDRYFLDRTCHKIFSLEGPGNIIIHVGNYSDFLEYKSLSSRPDKKMNFGKANHPATVKAQPSPLRFTYKEQLEYNTIQADIEALERELSSLDEEMSKTSSDFVRLQELYQKKEQTEDALLNKMERHEYLSNLEKQIKNSKT
ncbi:MAG: ABC-F family ATP-binding cassette domain-containing protein [Syntrophomonadaceae bacterium]|jgi:ATP-binding cassette subfamily F protein uup|nr:ABC-F family ATP-binding cassette domain-containing protein [Syntrophomonadaceae bacterium]